MADFAPPSGPPPPRVPEGWKAVWNTEYKEWFYVNTITKQSQWDKPTEPAIPAHEGAPPGGPPPGYVSGGNAPATAGQDIKKPVSPVPGSDRGAGNTNPYQQHLSNDQRESDEAMARRLQQEENIRNNTSSSTRGLSDSYYGQGQGQGGSQYPGQPQGYNSNQTNLAPQTSSYGGTSPGLQGADRGNSGGGFLGKLKDKFSQSGGAQRPYGQQGYGQQGGYPQQGYGGPPQGQYYPQQGYPQQGYGGYPPQGGYYGGQPQYMQQQPKRSGLGTGGAAALGVGGGLLGGMLLMDGMEHMEQNSYDQGYENGADDGGGDGGDMGGDGGDMGGDF